ncbi:hypothetical protein BKA62DRAFT_676103, partial [Auriculariales sp. MPI-PUGE-AT-0066]
MSERRVTRQQHSSVQADTLKEDAQSKLKGTNDPAQLFPTPAAPPALPASDVIPTKNHITGDASKTRESILMQRKRGKKRQLAIADTGGERASLPSIATTAMNNDMDNYKTLQGSVVHGKPDRPSLKLKLKIPKPDLPTMSHKVSEVPAVAVAGKSIALVVDARVADPSTTCTSNNAGAASGNEEATRDTVSKSFDVSKECAPQMRSAVLTTTDNAAGASCAGGTDERSVIGLDKRPTQLPMLWPILNLSQTKTSEPLWVVKQTTAHPLSTRTTSKAAGVSQPQGTTLKRDHTEIQQQLSLAFAKALNAALPHYNFDKADDDELVGLHQGLIRRVQFDMHHNLFGEYAPGDPDPDAIKEREQREPDTLTRPLMFSDDDLESEPDDETSPPKRAKPGPYSSLETEELNQMVDELQTKLEEFAQRTGKSLSSAVRAANILMKLVGDARACGICFRRNGLLTIPARKELITTPTHGLSASELKKTRDDYLKWWTTFKTETHKLNVEEGNLWKRMLKARDAVQSYVHISHLRYLLNVEDIVVVGAIVGRSARAMLRPLLKLLFASNDHIRRYMQRQGSRISAVLGDLQMLQ